MTEYSPKDLIIAAHEQNPVKFKEVFDALIFNKMENAITGKKIEITEELFSEEALDEHYTDHPHPTFHVRNPEQKTLMDHEIKGQISDGAWENAMPLHHSNNWSRANVKVEPHNLGTNFKPIKSDYGINRKDFLDLVGHRMLAHVRLGKAFGHENVKLLSHHLNLDGNFSTERQKFADAEEEKNPDGYWHKKNRDLKELHKKLGITPEHVKAAVENESLYSHKDLMNDLRDIKKHMKTRQGETLPKNVNEEGDYDGQEDTHQLSEFSFDLNPKKKGMWDGWSKEEIEAELAKLKKSGPHAKGSPEYTKEREAQFAINAKNHAFAKRS